jgi:hypothetical protein
MALAGAAAASVLVAIPTRTGDPASKHNITSTSIITTRAKSDS